MQSNLPAKEALMFQLIGFLMSLGKEIGKWKDEAHRRNAVIYQHLHNHHPEFFAGDRRISVQVKTTDGFWMSNGDLDPQCLVVPPDQYERFTNFWIAAVQCAARNKNGCPHSPGAGK